MKYHLATASGKWVGGFQVRRKADLASQLDDLRAVATSYKESLVATRLDGPRKGDTVTILPVAAKETA